MSGSTELLLLRLALIAVIFLFGWGVALSLGRSLSGPSTVRAAVPQQHARGWRLVVLSPGDSGLPVGAEFGLAGAMILGRDGEAGIMIADSSVSGRHATIERVQGGWKLSDLDSTNGTTANGRAVGRNGVLLRGGERVGLGAVVVRIDPPAGVPG
jgi:hypothetical protein